MTAAGNMRLNATSVVSARLQIEDVARIISPMSLDFKVTRSLSPTTEQAIQAFDIHDEQRRWADALAVHAESFVLMHELGHVYRYRFPLRSRAHFIRWALNSEKTADGLAGEWLMDNILSATPLAPATMMYAGAELALRVIVAMETVGIPF